MKNNDMYQEGDSAFEVVRIHKLDTGITKAFVDVSIRDEFVIKGIRVIGGKDGLFVSMPREVAKDGKWYNTVMPLTRQVKEELERIVLEAYGG